MLIIIIDTTRNRDFPWMSDVWIQRAQTLYKQNNFILPNCYAPYIWTDLELLNVNIGFLYAVYLFLIMESSLSWEYTYITLIVGSIYI